MVSPERQVRRWLCFYITSDMWKLIKILILVSINKISLGHSHANSFIYCLWLLLCYHVKLSNHNRDSRAQKSKLSIICPFTKKVCRPLYKTLLVMLPVDIPSFTKYLLGTYHVLGISTDITVNKSDKNV